MATIEFMGWDPQASGEPVEFEELGGVLSRVRRAAKKTVSPVAKKVLGKKLQGKLAATANVENVTKASKLGKTVIRSPILRVSLVGLAVICPPVGAPASAAVETANLIISQAEKGHKQAQEIIANTRKLAATGDKGAKAGLAILEAQGKARTQIQANRAAPKAGAIRPKPGTEKKPSVVGKLQMVQHALTPGTGKPPAGSVEVRGLFVTPKGLVFRP